MLYEVITDLTANAFLHHMVRNIVGCLVYVGKGKHEPVRITSYNVCYTKLLRIANPLATILSAAMMLRYTFNDEANATRIEDAVKKALAQGYRTADIWTEGTNKVGCAAMGDAVVAAL